MDIRVSNRDAWDRQVRTGNRWTVSVGPEVVTDFDTGTGPYHVFI